MSFADVFLLLTLLFPWASSAPVPSVKKPRAAPGGGEGH